MAGRGSGPVRFERKMRSGLGATLEGLDDDHATAATGTGLRERRHLAVIGIGGFGFCRDGAKQLAGPGDVGSAPAVGEQAVMTDAVEA